MQNTNLLVEGLTPTENKVYCLNGVGKQIKEIADLMNSSYETAKFHMKNIKQKLGLQKDKEVTAHFWCNLVGRNLDEVKKQIIASSLLLVMFLYLPYDQISQRSRLNVNRRTTVTRTVVARRNDF